jgi:hypothetical protein
MKLAEALVQRKALATKINELSARMAANALVHEGEDPIERPEALRAEMEQAIAELGVLVKGINRTNVATRLEDGQPIAEAIADRDMLQLHFRVLSTLAATVTSRTPSRYARTELRTLVTVDVPSLRRDVDDLARRIRELDVRIQAANWATDMLEA